MNSLIKVIVVLSKRRRTHRSNKSVYGGNGFHQKSFQPVMKQISHSWCQFNQSNHLFQEKEVSRAISDSTEFIPDSFRISLMGTKFGK